MQQSLARKQIHDQPQGRVENRQRLARQRGCRTTACLGQAMRARTQRVAIENFYTVPRQQRGVRSQGVDQSRRLSGHMAYQPPTDARFQPVQFIVHRGDRYPDLFGRGLVGKMDRVLMTKYDLAHQFEHRREQQGPGVLLLADTIKPAIQVLGIQAAFQHRTGHHGDRGALGKTSQQRGQRQGHRAWPQKAA